MSLDSASPVLLTIGAIALTYILRRKAKTLPLPPGPRGLPLLGNVLDIPPENHWVKFAELGDVWGPIATLRAPGQTLIIVNSLAIAETLLEVHGANFADRTVIPMGGEITGFKNVLAMAQYGDRVRAERKIFHQLFSTRAKIVDKFGGIIEEEVRRLLLGILADPEDVDGLIGRRVLFTGAITLKIAYGYHVPDAPQQDPLLEMFETAGRNFAQSMKPAAFLVDLVPLLMYWPEWLPGGDFHRIGREWAAQLHATVNSGYQYAKERMTSTTSCFVSSLIEQGKHDEYLIKWAAASIQQGGADTTASALRGFLLAMSMYPEIQARAQQEIDSVVAAEARLPTVADRGRLPYIEALCKEVLRWHVVIPAVPHRTSEDFVYERGDGLPPFLIPRDSVIVANIWKFAHDPNIYDDPEVFNPSRFLETSEMDPARICFGFGRRICPGKLLASETLFITVASLLSVFRISKPRIEGVPIKEGTKRHPGQTSGIVTHPIAFQCTVEPRGERAVSFIRQGEL
ncbi:cytochrome P450 [Roridomyces roridus]|uniref:Cytochrome P450 n=1 Tax=Roridomyces roridus TaxID=1738132 RepID=A0AAD7FFB5_9AGAR|nr:cytochrome P450 [Roridomyces roridus]